MNDLFLPLIIEGFQQAHPDLAHPTPQGGDLRRLKTAWEEAV
jgi:hypothetical protein